ncbi:MAG TPA: hypothetical protein PKY46_13605, partial [Ignavibacteriaceae bacterium]|nr:hypothetical protein [Ignavibacteriaceae bacterium]
ILSENQLLNAIRRAGCCRERKALNNSVNIMNFLTAMEYSRRKIALKRNPTRSDRKPTAAVRPVGAKKIQKLFSATTCVSEERGERTEDRGRRTEDRRRNTEDGIQKTENRRRKTEVWIPLMRMDEWKFLPLRTLQTLWTL